MGRTGKNRSYGFNCPNRALLLEQGQLPVHLKVPIQRTHMHLKGPDGAGCVSASASKASADVTEGELMTEIQRHCH